MSAGYTTPVNGSLAVGASAVQIGASTPIKYKVLILAANGNTSGKAVYVGFSSAVTANSAHATDGYQLYPGQSVQIDAAACNFDANNVWLIADASSQEAFFLGW